MSFDVPEGWLTVALQELNIRENANIIPSNFGDTIFELWSVPAFSTGHPEYIQGNEIGSNKQKVQFGDVLLCKINPRINRVWKVGKKEKYPQIASTEWIIIHCPQVNPDYLVYYFQERNFREALCAEVSGVGGSLIRARPQSVFKLNVKIPPLNEQKRIVSKIEALQQRSDRAKTELEAIKPLLDQFRRSVLSAAFRGDLTRDWREQNPDVEPAEVLLEKIKTKRFNRNLNQKQLDKLTNIYSYQENNYSNYLPTSWQYATLEKLCESFEYGSSFKSSKEGKIPVLRMGNLQKGEIDWNDLVYSSNEEEIKKYLLSPLTVLFNRTNSSELVGKTSIYRGDYPAIFAGYLIRINNFIELNPEYLNYGLNTQMAKDYFFQVKTDGVNQSNINAQKLAKFELPLCSVEEQTEIVRRINNLFKLSDSIEQHYQQATDQLENLNQSILAKAFRGELVPQDPNDEPASVLLERIKAEKAKAEQPKRIPKKSSKKEIEQLNLFE